MSKNPFVVLGIDENSTQNEIFDAYKVLRNKYSDLRFAEGEAGADACAKMEEIELAYQQATDIARSRYNVEYSGSNLSDVENAIKSGKIDEAQNILDDCQDRTAQWHYLQSVIFYKKNWTSDALKQLEFACNMEPTNQKYTEAKQNMINKINANSAEKDTSYYRNTANGEQGQRSYTRPTGANSTNSMCNCCSSLICADCCCECMGGDLIACC
jgi:hypothetical protein